MLYTLDRLKQAIAQDPDQWRPLVFTNGCFDLLHVGHVRYLMAARRLGKRLVVGLNSDISVQGLKPAKPGYPARPIVPEFQRGEVLAALKPVDGVVVFSEPTAGPTIAALQPDIYVKGGDYTIDTLPETPIVQGYGGEIKLIPVEIDTGTTGIIEKILGSR
ncbi:MAG: adenylyltransferase/cytidyltransferase family protein [Cyanobacteria bacterium P01_F01_bin.153]